MELMMMMDGDALNDLREEFRSRPKRDPAGFALDEFVAVMLEKLPHPDTVKFTTELCELFAQIDVNGDGTMEWEEFTSYCIEAGIVATRHLLAPLRYKMSEHPNYVDHTSRGPSITSLTWCEQLQQLFVFEAQSTKVRIYSPKLVEIGEVVLPPSELIAYVTAGCYIHERNMLVISATNFSINFWDLASKCVLGIGFTRTSQSSLCAATDVVYSCGGDRWLHMWSLKDYSLLARFTRHTDLAISVMPIKEHNLLLSTSMDKKILLWELGTSTPRGQLTGHSRGVRQVIYIKKMDLAISCGFDCDALGWDLTNRRQVIKLRGHRFPLVGVQELSRKGIDPRALTGDRGGTFKVWDVSSFHTGQAVCLQSFTCASDLSKFTPNCFVTLQPTGNMVAAGMKLHLFISKPVVAGEVIPTIALFNPVTRMFATAADNTVALINEQGRVVEELFDLSDGPITVMIMDDRRRKLIVGNQLGQILVFNYVNGALMKQSKEEHSADVTSLFYVDADKILISTSWDRRIRVYDENEPDCLELLRGIDNAHHADITCVAASHDTSLIASGAADCTLRVWDYLSVKMEVEFVGHEAEVTAVAFCDSYPLLISTDAGGGLFLWGTRFGELENRYTCMHMHRNVVPSDADTAQVFITGSVPSLVPVGITCLAVFQVPGTDDRLIVIADDHGQVQTFDLEDAVRRLGLQPVPDGRKPGARLNYNPRMRVTRQGPPPTSGDGSTSPPGSVPATSRLRPAESRSPSIVSVTSSEPRKHSVAETGTRMHRMRSVRSGIFRQHGTPTHKAGHPTPTSINAVKLPALRLVSKWQAHSDSIVSMRMFDDPPGVITCSYDMSVRLWSIRGDPLGIVAMGRDIANKISQGIMPAVPWTFRTDSLAREGRRLSEANHVLDSITDLADEQKAQEEAAAAKAASQASFAGRHRSVGNLKVVQSPLRSMSPPLPASSPSHSPIVSETQRTSMLEQIKVEGGEEEDDNIVVPDNTSQPSGVQDTDSESDDEKVLQDAIRTAAVLAEMAKNPLSERYRSFVSEKDRKNNSRLDLMDLDTTPSQFLTSKIPSNILASVSRKARRQDVVVKASAPLTPSMTPNASRSRSPAGRSPSPPFGVTDDSIISVHFAPGVQSASASGLPPIVGKGSTASALTPGVARRLPRAMSERDCVAAEASSMRLLARGDAFLQRIQSVQSLPFSVEAVDASLAGHGDVFSMSAVNPAMSPAAGAPSGSKHSLAHSQSAPAGAFMSGPSQAQSPSILSNSSTVLAGSILEKAVARLSVALQDDEEEPEARVRSSHGTRRASAASSVASVPKPEARPNSRDKTKTPGHQTIKVRKTGLTFGAYTEKDLRELKSLFDTFDVDGSGSISVVEFKNSGAWTKMNFPSLAGSLFESLDKDRSGDITIEEMMRVVFPLANEQELKAMSEFCMKKAPAKNKNGPRVLSKEKEEELREIFRLYDKRGRGMLSHDDLWAALAPNWGEILTRQDLRRMCAENNIPVTRPITADDFVVLLSGVM